MDESYLLLLLADGNLPTGSFVASSGLESYLKHGLSAPFHSSASILQKKAAPPLTQTTVNFIRDSVQTYARSTLPFIRAVYEACSKDVNDLSAPDNTMSIIKTLDALYESMTLNHVARRASTTQGVAHLTLLSKGLTRPLWISSLNGSESLEEETHSKRLDKLAEELKFSIRRGDTPGHLPICWGILTSILGLSCERSQHLHIFLHARSLISASIRLNTVGPYAAQQLLLHIIQPLIEDTVRELSDARIQLRDDGALVLDEEEEGEGEDQGPAMTWPLGEILASRHDLQHSRIFNS